MSYLYENNSENLAARITYNGRRKIAQGDFNISYFQIGDSEFDYGFSTFDGINTIAQKVLTPLDKESQIKYPYKVSDSTLTGTTYGMPSQTSIKETIRNNVGPAGYVSEYVEYNSGSGTGTSVECFSEEIDISTLNGTTSLSVSNGSEYNITQFITIYFSTLTGSNNIIKEQATSLVYRVVSINGNTLTLDRTTPDFTALAGIAITVICNNCVFPDIIACNETVNVEAQQDPWALNTIWGQNPAGLDPLDNTIDEKLSGYTSNAYTSSKEYFGYNTSSGQTSNSGTTIVNSFGDILIVPPEEQHSLGLLHYSKANDILIDPWLSFKYEDYIDHSVGYGEDNFEIYIPFIYYERNSSSTIGARFFMDTTDYYINSAAIDAKPNQMKYRYLLDEYNNKVGKIFVNHKVIVFDDQEIVAALEYKSNRRYTLPIPRISSIPIDVKCESYAGSTEPLMVDSGDTVFITYLLQYAGGSITGLNGLACNYYNKIIGSTIPSDVSIIFNTTDFRYMQYTGEGGSVYGYIADTFKILIQKVDTGDQPDPTQWREIDFTSEIPNHTPGDIINPANLRGTRFIITNSDYESSSIYTMWDPDLVDTTTSPEFGDEQPFTGSIKLTRATDLETMIYLINLPSTDFMNTQNPTYIYGLPKRITEVALLDRNKDVVVIAKTGSPIVRVGTQVLSVKIDI
jgi:hypothetical protein